MPADGKSLTQEEPGYEELHKVGKLLSCLLIELDMLGIKPAGDVNLSPETLKEMLGEKELMGYFRDLYGYAMRSNLKDARKLRIRLSPDRRRR